MTSRALRHGETSMTTRVYAGDALARGGRPLSKIYRNIFRTPLRVATLFTTSNHSSTSRVSFEFGGFCLGNDAIPKEARPSGPQIGQVDVGRGAKIKGQRTPSLTYHLHLTAVLKVAFCRTRFSGHECSRSQKLPRASTPSQANNFAYFL